MVGLWAILYGVAMFATGHETKWSYVVYSGLLLIFIGLIIPSWLPAWTYDLAGFVFGIPMIVIGVKTSKKKK